MGTKKQASKRKRKSKGQRDELVSSAVINKNETPPLPQGNLPEHQTTRSLRQAQLLQLQQQKGNHHVQRRLKGVAADNRQPGRSSSQVSAGAVGDQKLVQRGLWGSIKKIGKKVVGGVKKGVKAAWKGVRKGAGAIKKGLGYAWTGLKWVGRQSWYKMLGIFHRVKGWMTKLPARVGRLLSHLWNGVKSLKPWSLSWWKSLGSLGTWGDFLKWLGTAGIQLLEIAGIGEIYETVMDILKFNTRPLTTEEIGKARIVFGGSIDYNLVRVDEWALIGPSWTKRAYVSFNTINSWGDLDDHTLIHELTHVWQYTQMGAIYMPKAIHAQKTGGYAYGGVAELARRQAAGKGFTSFNLEQQGQILGDYYVGKSDGSLSGINLQTYEHFVQQVRR